MHEAIQAGTCEALRAALGVCVEDHPDLKLRLLQWMGAGAMDEMPLSARHIIQDVCGVPR